MLWKFVLPLCLLAYSASATISMDLEPILSQQHHAMRLLIKTYSSESRSSDEIDFEGCFLDYSDGQDELVDDYKTNYMGCIKTATDARSKLTAESAESRADLLERGHNICTQLTDCENLTDGLAFFQCYNNASSKNYPELYNISTESEAEATAFQIQYYQIKNNEEKCTTTSKNTYVSSMADCNAKFQLCLIGESVTKTPTTDTPVTDAPVESTEEPIVTDAPVETTEEPIVTDAPVETTEEPIVTDAPVESTEEPIVTDAPVETTEEPIVTDAPVEPTEEPIVTDAPAEPTTEEHIEPNMDIMPEEDLQSFRTQPRMHLWNKLKSLY